MKLIATSNPCANPLFYTGDIQNLPADDFGSYVNHSP
jgi:hypothetical protein